MLVIQFESRKSKKNMSEVSSYCLSIHVCNLNQCDNIAFLLRPCVIHPIPPQMI